MSVFNEQDHPRNQVGQWREKPQQSSGVALAPEPVDDPSVEPDKVWRRIDSLMAARMHLDPERTVKPPTFGPDDNVQQMARKMSRYVAKTQDLSDVPDDEIRDLCGLDDPPEPKRMQTQGELDELNRILAALNYEPQKDFDTDVDVVRQAFDIPNEDRIVVGMRDGTPVYVSLGSTVKKSGSYRVRRVGNVTVMNASELMVAHDVEQAVVADHPDLDPRLVRVQTEHMVSGTYAGKKYARTWDEDRYSNRAMLAIVSGARTVGDRELLDVLDKPDNYRTVAGYKSIVDSVVPDRARELVAALPDDGGGRVGVSYDPYNPRSPRLSVDRSEVEQEVAGTSRRAQRAAVNRAISSVLYEKGQQELDSSLNRQYVRDGEKEHSATVFEQKKNVPQRYLDAANQSVFRATGDFRHVEVDEDVDLDRLRHIEREYERIRRFIPETPVKATLRWRKTGRHRAAGVYHPHVANVAVDPRHPDSAIHEMMHHLDYTAGEKNISMSDDFRPILRSAQQRLRASSDPAVASKIGYYTTPTEVHSRAAELYFYWKGLQTSLNGDDTKYSNSDAYRAMSPMKDQIISFFDRKFTELGAEVPPTQ